MADNKDTENTQIRLTGELVNKVMRVLTEHEPQCQEGVVSCQYLSAIQAMLICERVPQEKIRLEIVDELGSFMRYAVEDMSKASGQASGPAGGQTRGPAPANPQDAVGVWKPGEE